MTEPTTPDPRAQADPSSAEDVHDLAVDTVSDLDEIRGGVCAPCSRKPTNDTD